MEDTTGKMIMENVCIATEKIFDQCIKKTKIKKKINMPKKFLDPCRVCCNPCSKCCSCEHIDCCSYSHKKKCYSYLSKTECQVISVKCEMLDIKENNLSPVDNNTKIVEFKLMIEIKINIKDKNDVLIYTTKEIVCQNIVIPLNLPSSHICKDSEINITCETIKASCECNLVIEHCSAYIDCLIHVKNIILVICNVKLLIPSYGYCYPRTCIGNDLC
jgi:hypothetical protein